MKQFQTLKSDLTQSRIIDIDSASIGDGEITVQVESYAFTSNNVTYGVAGDTIGYWKFSQPEMIQIMNGAAFLCGDLLRSLIQALKI